MKKKQVTFRFEIALIKILKFLAVKQDRSLTDLIPWSNSRPSQKLQERKGEINEILQ